MKNNNNKVSLIPGILLSGLMLSMTSQHAAAASAVMPVQGLTTQPIGHYEFCQRAPKECLQKTSAKPVKLTRKLWAEMLNVNTSANTLVSPVTDQELWGRPEVWSYPTSFGDCEDYVLLKRKMLMQAGVPAGNLLITVVRLPNGDGHAVLTVRTNRGDFVLDNLKGEVKLWKNTEYRFLKRQSHKHSGKWVSINDSRNMAVGAIK